MPSRAHVLPALAALGVALGAPGCSDDDEARTTFRCQLDDWQGPSCYELVGLPTDQVDDHEKSCSLSKGQVVEACPAEGQTNLCVIQRGDKKRVDRYYSADTTGSQQQTCESKGGTFSYVPR